MFAIVTAAVLGLLGDDTLNSAPTDAQASTRPPATAAAAADSVVAAAFKKPIDTPAADQKAAPTISVPSSPEWTNFVAPGLAILGLAGLAFGLTRRRRALPGSIRVLESASLGPKRSLVIAEVLGEKLVLGVSEAGVSVLMTRPVVAAEVAPESTFELAPAPPRAPEMGFFERLMGRRNAPRFEEVLGDSIEDQELRAKLAAGVRGTVP